MTLIEYLILIPILTGLILLFVPEKIKPVKAGLTILTSGFILFESCVLYFKGFTGNQLNFLNSLFNKFRFSENFPVDLNSLHLFRIDALSNLIILFIGLFTFLIAVYSFLYIRKEKKIYNFYGYVLLTLGASNGAVLSNHLILFLTFWGFLAITLYKLIKVYDDESARAAMKSLILLGGSDVLMLFGIGLIWNISGSLNMYDLSIETTNATGILAFIALLIGAFTKAGAFPFHTWIPEYTKKAPVSSSAYLPASLDKLVGIYFLARLCHGMFILNQWLTFSIIFLGIATIIIGVMMALVQHDYKKLLGYHAVSQVGYMVTGLGLGTGLGLIGGLFHMINNSLYKNGLFLVAGNVEEKSKKNDLAETGGLAGNMPITFITALVFALSISGIPPLNGFASKWIIYQGIIDFGKGVGVANNLWIVWLALAVIGSALTLASFIKFISGIFLGTKKPELSAVKETNAVILISPIVLALMCMGFGVFATNYVVPYLFKPIVGDLAYTGSWNSVTISLLVLVSIILGLVVYAVGNVKRFRREESFIGGEQMQGFAGLNITEFYQTISDSKPFSFIYQKAQQKWFDIYDLSKDGALWLTRNLSKTHNGILLTYALWLVLGLLLLLIVFYMI